MALEDLLKTINEEADRTQLTALLDKYSPVKVAIERGDSIAPIYEKLTALGLKPDAEAARLPEWVDWRTKHWNAQTGKWDFVIAVESERDQLAAKVAALEAKGDTEMTADEIKALADAQFDARMKAVLEDPNNPVIRKEALLGSLNSTAQRFQEIYSTLTPLAVEHSAKYKEPLPVKEVLEYIEKTGERDPLKAYQAVLVPRDNKLEIERLKSEAASAKEAGIQEGIKQAQAKVNGARLPVDGGGSQRVGSHFMNRIFKRREASANAGNQRLGSGAASQAGFAEWQQKKMAGGAV